MQIFARIRYLLVLLISRRSRLYEVLRLVRMQVRQNGLRALFQSDTWTLVLSRFKIQYIINHLSQVGDYQTWLKRREPSRRQLIRQSKQAGRFAYRPLISIITPVYNPAPDVLRDTIQSVVAQTYANWEFCLANGSLAQAGQPNQAVREALDSASKADARIQVIHLEQNLGISGNTNAALTTARGDFVLLLDHDDLLAPDLLYEVVRKLNEVPDADVVYYDEDTVSADRLLRRFPWFKPSALSPDLMLSANYLMHSVIRRSLVEEVGRFDPNVDGAQDWDLALKLIERMPRCKFVHIPRVFYHWRAVPGSVASDADAKPWAYAAQKRCLEAHLQRTQAPGARVEFPGKGIVHVRWPLSDEHAHIQKVSIIIPTRDKVDYLAACIQSILDKTSYPDFEIIVVDNNSREPATLQYLGALPKEDSPKTAHGSRVNLRVLPYPRPYNFHKINNFAASQAEGNIFVFLNNDTEALDPDWLSELAGWVRRPEIGIAGAKLLHPDGTFQHAGIIMGMLGHGSHVFDGAQENTYGPFGSSEWVRDYQAVTGACLAIRKQVFNELGGFDETYRVGYGDIDLCLRCNRAGYRVIYTPFARLLHHEGGTRGFSLPAGDVLRASYFMLQQATSQDAYYNPNLSHLERIPTLARGSEEPRPWRLLSILETFDLVAAPAYRFKDGAIFPDGGQGGLLPHRREKFNRRCAILVTHELSRTGAPILLLELAKYLDKLGWQVTMLSPTEGSLHESCDQANIKVELVPSLLSDARLLLPYLAEADLVMANTILTYRMVHAAQAFGIPSMWWIYESGFGAQFVKDHPAASQAMQAASAVIFAAETTRSLYGEVDNAHTIYTGIDVPPAERERCSKPLDLDRNYYNIVLIASIEHRKGQDIFIKAYASLPPDIQAKTRGYLIGRHLDALSADRKFYQEILKDTRSLPNIQVLGELPEPDVRFILSQTDLFVLPSRDEVLPVTILEAMAFAKPILTTRVGGIPEIIQHDVNGILVDADDSTGLRDQMVRLSGDPEMSQRLGQEARKTYESRLTYSTFASQVLKLVDEL